MIWGKTKIQAVEGITKEAKAGVTEHPETSLQLCSYFHLFLLIGCLF